MLLTEFSEQIFTIIFGKVFSENDWLVRFSMDKIVGGPCVYLVGG